MLKQINKIYFVFTTFLYVLIGVLFSIELKALYMLNYFSALTMSLLITYLFKQPDSFFTRKKMVVIVFYYTTFFVFCYNLISYYYSGNLYVFSESDAVLYHNEASVMSRLSFVKGIDYYLSRHETEDLGMALILGGLYKFHTTKILLNCFYILLAIITANSIFSIAKRFMSNRYAFFCVIIYSLSSFVLWFHSSGLKETALVTLITAFYNSYYNFVLDKKLKSIWWLILLPLFILLFRPVLSIFCLASLAIGVVLNRKLTVPQLLFLFAVLIGSIFSFEIIISSTDKFLLGGVDSMLESKQLEGMVKQSVSFTYFVNILSSMFGPFPSIASAKPHLSFYAPGLILKIFISIGFWFGFFQVFKLRWFRVYPILIFTIIEMISLTYIIESLELRKSLPHFPLVYIISFIFIYKFDAQKLKNLKEHLFYKKTFTIASFVLCGLIVYWNFR